MSIPRSSLESIPTSFATVSVGTPEDPLEDKLKAISAAGFQAIELGFPDLLSFTSKYHTKDVEENDYTSLCSAGTVVKDLCKKHNLSIMMLQPFSNFEGWALGSKERDDAFSRAKGWIRIMQAVGTDMLQVGSSDSPNISTSHDVLASDLRELADLLAPHSFRLAYENWCWATVAPTWFNIWTIVQKVNRPNIGLCLDTFQTCAGEYGDPCSASGLIENKGLQQKLEMNFKHSLIELAKTVPPEKVCLLQISDVYKAPVPFKDETVDGLRPRGRWSHDFRPYLFNGGYLTPQCVEFAKAVLQTGARCWFSTEVFDGGPDGKGGMKQYEMGAFCKGAMESHKKLLDACADS
ncbi:xylose isomerase-like protein [Mollisia scopiformis]|uniref:Xylose isomerase-like protein n=1 Tax=Mollisia scopiformis TaxID=149040 RepID=A0A194XRK6_MOLSC|nr:xylose isomerase-like protein [Mollisia scopiformis]KUJ22684.1 xylose isomerase-like protein [Mollisia scopiformis]